MTSILPTPTRLTPAAPELAQPLTGLGNQRTWSLFGAAVFLVSVPVFAQAPLVREFPWLSLALTLPLLILSRWWLTQPKTRLWGDLLFGFCLCWLAGTLYWGWLRWEPTWHLPIESLGLPVVAWLWPRQQLRIGSLFYLGSLLGTAITDLYFYLVDLMPAWRQLMQIDPAMAFAVLQSALTRMYTPWGLAWAVILALGLLFTGLAPLGLLTLRQNRVETLPWWGFSGAVLSTLLVDGLFWVVAQLAN